MLRFLLRSMRGRLPLAGLAWVGWCGCRAEPPKAPLVEPEPVQAAPPPAPLSLAPNPPILLQEVGFLAPTAALHDAEEDVYLIANANGNLGDADGNGFISRVSPDGTVASLKWIDGAAGAGLDAPTGMVISGDKLLVADLNVVRSFNRKTGEALGKVAVPNAHYLADLALAPDGSVYISDTGLAKQKGSSDLKPTGADTIFKLEANGSVKLFSKTPELGQPTGLLADGNGVWVVNLKGELQRWSADGQRMGSAKLPGSVLRGLAEAEAGRLLIASTESSTVYTGKTLTGAVPQTFEPLLTELATPGDIAYDRKRKQLIVPLTRGNALYMQEIPAG